MSKDGTDKRKAKAASSKQPMFTKVEGMRIALINEEILTAFVVGKTLCVYSPGNGSGLIIPATGRQAKNYWSRQRERV